MLHYVPLDKLMEALQFSDGLPLIDTKWKVFKISVFAAKL